MKIAVTGASGFVGQHLINALLNDGYDLHVLYNRTPPMEHQRIKQFKGGLDDVGVLKDFVRGCDVVIHVAGLVAAPSAAIFEEVNVVGTANLVQACEVQRIERFLLISSVAARVPDLSPYAHSKRGGEKVLEASELKSWDILRPPAIYGPGDTSIMPLVQAVKLGVGPLPAGRQAQISVVHVLDVVGAIVAWLKSGITTQEAYEISDPKVGGYTWKELMGMMGKGFGRRVRCFVPPRFLLEFYGHVSALFSKLFGLHLFLSLGKVRELCHPDWACDPRPFQSVFGYGPQIDFVQGFEDTLAWYRVEKLI